MHSFKVFIGLFTAGILALGAGVALASEEAAKVSGGAIPAAQEAKAPEGSKATSGRAMQKAEIRHVRGVVAAIEPNATPPAMVVKVMEGKTPLSSAWT